MLVILAVGLAGGLGACSSSGGSSAAPAAAAASSSAAPSDASSPASPASSSSTDSGALPKYEPSTVISDAGGHIQLSSPDPVSKVTDFYDNALKTGGWSVTSSTKSGYNTTIVAKRDGQGATISISAAGASGTSISVSTYPT